MKKFLLSVLLLIVSSGGFLAAEQKPLKILHLSLHRGCIEEFEGVAKVLSLDLTSWFLQDLPSKFLDGQTEGNSVYNMGHDRAEKIWAIHSEYFKTFDAVITSDTAPLSRIFLQNGWDKPLLIWICNRFDYYDGASLDCDFPDQEYYDLFQKATKQSNVKMIAYNEFEHHYARRKGIDTGSLTITPCGLFNKTPGRTLIPSEIVKENTFFLPPYHNETIFMNLSEKCRRLGIPNYCGRYAGASDLKDFKGLIHIPYAWSNLAFFENIRQGIPYFIPSLKFFKKLAVMPNFFLPNISYLVNDGWYHLTEWYSPEHAEVFTYFDSWSDLKNKVNQADLPALREKVKAYAKKYEEKTLQKWRDVFDLPTESDM